MKRIIFPTDFSEAAKHARHAAISLARKQHAQLILLHAFAPPEVFAEAGTIYMEQHMQRLQDDVDTRLAQQIEMLKIEAQDIDIIPRSAVGFPADVICDVAREEAASMIVMGTEGASGLKRLFLGSVSARVIEAAPCPVLAIPEHVDSFSVNRIVYATNYQSEELEALKRVAIVAAAYDAEIVVLHVAEKDKELLDEVFVWYETLVRQELEYPKLSFELLPPAPLQEALKAYVGACDADMLAMSRRQRGLIGRLFGTSESKEMAYSCKCPLLIFHSENLIDQGETAQAQMRGLG
jgi:nucleotide-binding universal stress UspA family protein